MDYLESPHSGVGNVNESSLSERIYWLIRLRWIAVIGVSLTTFFTDNFLNISVPILSLYIIAAILAIYNFLFLMFLNQINKQARANFSTIVNRVANTQISLDLLTLATLIHFSGGIENPFIFYFIFHMIIASILLSRVASFLQATFATILFCSMISLEYFGILHHYCLKGFAPSNLHNNLVYMGGISFVFISTIYIAVYMATSISSRLRERERSLKQANKLLTEKDRMKTEYVLRVTHDIKEHLAAVQSCIEPVTGGFTGVLNARQMDLLQRADQRTSKLLVFVKALLEISHIKLSKYVKMEYFSLHELIKNALAYIETRAKNKDIEINAHIDRSIDKLKGVEPYIEETIANILANAVKYTPPKGKINLTVEDKGDSVIIKIQDTGIGIPKNALSKIFDEFYRASNAKKVIRDGTGLGLSIAKQVIERHDGKIWVESEEGKGSTFYIKLPK
jgi:signal transduction histidine kinase